MTLFVRAKMPTLGHAVQIELKNEQQKKLI